MRALVCLRGFIFLCSLRNGRYSFVTTNSECFGGFLDRFWSVFLGRDYLFYFFFLGDGDQFILLLRWTCLFFLLTRVGVIVLDLPLRRCHLM